MNGKIIRIPNTKKTSYKKEVSKLKKKYSFVYYYKASTKNFFFVVSDVKLSYKEMMILINRNYIMDDSWVKKLESYEDIDPI